MEKKDFDIHEVEEVISFVGGEEMATTALAIKGEIYSEESSEVNMRTLDNTIESVLLNSNASVPYPFKEKDQQSLNDCGTSFYFVGIKMEEPDDYERKASCVNSETKNSSRKYLSNHERKCNVDDQGLEGKLFTKLDNTCIKIKVESEEDIGSFKLDFQTNEETSMTIDENSKFNSRSVVRGCDMGHSSNEFIRGIECQKYPILRVKEEEENTEKKIAVNTNNSVQIGEQEKQDDLTCSASADWEYNIEEYTNKGGNVEEENKFLTESTIKIESKEETDVCDLNCPSIENIYMKKTLESNSGSTIHSVDSEKKNSNVGKSRCANINVQVDPERNVVQIYQNTTFDAACINDHSKDHSVAKRKGLEIQFESICDVCEFDIKVEKPFGSGLNSENVCELDDKPAIFEPLSVILKDEPVELESKCENLLTKNSSQVVLERVSLQGLYPSHRTEIGKEASGFRGNSCLSETIEKKEYYKIFKGQEALRSERCVAEFSLEENCAGKYNPSVEKGFSCNIRHPICDEDKSLKTVAHFNTRENPILCYICGKNFREKKFLKEHMRCHSAEKSVPCQVCSACFTCMGDLQKHMRTHTGEKPFSCDFCDSSFSVKRSLKRHMRTHTGEKPFFCVVCHSTFSVKSSLNRHLRTHTGEKPMSCNVCRTSFSEKGHLIRHMRTHTGEKPFSCDFCNVSFTQKGVLKSHMRTHTGDKPYSCDVCKVSFSMKGNLKRHMLKHTGDKLI